MIKRLTKPEERANNIFDSAFASRGFTAVVATIEIRAALRELVEVASQLDANTLAIADRYLPPERTKNLPACIKLVQGHLRELVNEILPEEEKIK